MKKAICTKKKRWMNNAAVIFGLLLTTVVCLSEVKAEQLSMVGASSVIIHAGAKEKSSENQETEETTTIDGVIKSVKKGKFRITLVITEDEDDGLISAHEKEDEIITVRYNKKTEFIISTSSDGGITSKKKAGTSKALKKKHPVLIEGTWNGKKFDASKVTIYYKG